MLFVGFLEKNHWHIFYPRHLIKKTDAHLSLASLRAPCTKGLHPDSDKSLNYKIVPPPIALVRVASFQEWTRFSENLNAYHLHTSMLKLRTMRCNFYLKIKLPISVHG